MTERKTDPLLLAGKLLALFLQGALALGAAAVVISIPIALFAQGDFLKGFIAGSELRIDALPLAPLVTLLVVALAMAVALFTFLGKLRAIIDTVGAGDAFIPANAQRLSTMAWLLLSTQLLSVPAVALAAMLAQAVGKVGKLKIAIVGDGLDLTGLLLVLVLFILARVFREGAAMRADLEGTV